MINVTPENVIRLAVEKQRLANPLPPTADGLDEIMHSIRCLQIDPIRAVERTQYLVLFSRMGPFPMQILDQAAYERKNLFEYWAHAASYVLTEDYPIHSYNMRNIKFGAGAAAQRYKKWLETNTAYERYVLDTIRENGPTLVNDLEDHAINPWESRGWTSSRNAAMMVYALWDRGELLVADRDGNKKYWDLAERVLPEWTPREKLSEFKVTCLAAQYALKGLGIANMKQINNHFTRKRYPQLEEVITELADEGTFVPVKIVGDGQDWDRKGAWYIHKEDLPALERTVSPGKLDRTVLLSPFDNLISDRERTEMFWNFRFRIEIYVPAKKREFGYYVMPILHGDRLIGRIDPSMDRKSGTLQINNVYRESEAPEPAEVISGVKEAIHALGDFLGAERIDFTGNIPSGWLGIKD